MPDLIVRKPILHILLFSFLIRFYHIDFPISGHHSWRQADTASIARNFFENGFNIFYPQVNWSGNTPGYVESEFQIYPFLAALMYSVFGERDLCGRLLSVLFTLFTIYGICLLTRRTINEQPALWSAFIYSVLPLNIYYDRAF